MITVNDVGILIEGPRRITMHLRYGAFAPWLSDVKSKKKNIQTTHDPA